jgi:type I restriction enzyme, S subunit
VPFEIPESWEWVRISGIFSIINGDRGKNYPAKSTLSNTGIPFISAVNLNEETVIEDDNLLCLSDEQFNKLGSGKLEKDDVVVCIRGSLGKHGRYPFEKGAIASSLVILRPHLNIPLLSDFIMIYLDSPLFFSEIKRYDNGTAQPNLSAKSLEIFFVPLPPLSEQKRIVDKLNEVSSYTDSYLKTYVRVTELNQKFPGLLKKSILQEAVQGKLVPQDPADEPASDLLKRIRAEKQRLIAEGKIKKEKHESVIFRRDNSHYEKRGSEEVCIDDEIPFELPNGWRWCRFSTICYKLTDGSHNPPPKRANGFRVISARNIKNGRILFTDEDRLCDQNGFNKENPRTQISKGDVILGIIGGSIGNTAIYGYDEPVIAQRSIAIFGSLINNKYMKLLLDSPLFQQQFNSKSNGTAQGGIYLGELANMLVPLPPVNEQNRILASISSLENKIVTM